MSNWIQGVFDFGIALRFRKTDLLVVSLGFAWELIRSCGTIANENHVP
jgi:hypothetical protein